MIVCGWCGKPTTPERCIACGHTDPARPWVQRGQEPPAVRVDAVGRRALDPAHLRRRLAEAYRSLGEDATVAQLAEHFDVSDRSVRRWQRVAEGGH